MLDCHLCKFAPATKYVTFNVQLPGDRRIYQHRMKAETFKAYQDIAQLLFGWLG